jgi:hypothetical protein
MARGYNKQPGGGDAVYGIGLIGALIYFIGQAHTFGAFLLAILQSLVWPAYVVYHLLKFLHVT